MEKIIKKGGKFGLGWREEKDWGLDLKSLMKCGFMDLKVLKSMNIGEGQRKSKLSTRNVSKDL